jgi:hypothetical protein
MRCDDVLLELGSPATSEAVRAHLEGCAECRSTAVLIDLAALPPVSSAERAGLEGLASATQARWRSQEHRRVEGAGRWQRLAQLALAAGVGALLATGALSWRQHRAGAVSPSAVTFQLVALEVPVLPEPELDEPNLSDDEVFFEVSWPQPTEGDL